MQDFDERWEQALLLTSDPPSDKVWSVRFQVARFLSNSDNYGTKQSRNSVRSVCEIAY